VKQVVLSPRTGALDVSDVPVPRVRRGTVLVRNAASVVSAGTERLVIELAGKSLLGKARARPELVREALNKVRREGLRTTVREAFLRLERPFPLGYSCAGTVVEAGEGVTRLRPGDRVACAGANWAHHAEVVVVPEELCVPLPAQVSAEAGAFAMLGGIALHGVRRSGVQRGGVAAVIGLGLLGQLTLQLLKGMGCRAVGYDVAGGRASLARELGAAAATSADDAKAAVMSASGGAGADAVIITAATSSNAPVELAADLARMGGAVVMVGVTGMNLPRRPYWEKELAFLLSRSSLPADNAEFIAAIASGEVRVGPLVTHRFPIAAAKDAYALIRGRTRQPHLGVVLTYPEREGDRPAAPARAPAAPPPSALDSVAVGMIGSGLFAQTVLLPALRRLPGVRLRAVATQTGLSARHTAERFGFERCTTDAADVLDDPEIRAVVIATRHDLHAAIAADALRRGKHVFVEKPLALTVEDLRAVLAAHAASGRVLVVGFNRRYSPLVRTLREFLHDQRPLALTYQVNAGDVPSDHWVYDAREGGGRWLGEGGHFVDVLQYLTGRDPVEVVARESRSAAAGASGRTLLVTLMFGDGCAGSVVYADGADRAGWRERLDAYGAGTSATLEDYRRLTLVRAGRVRRIRRAEAARGHREELAAWMAAVRGLAPAPVPASTYAANTLAGFAALESVRTGRAVPVDLGPITPAAGNAQEGSLR
jgi:predicted dehydrogenase/threonine dehydrogenase-like Zn-dependent dehydrogenase